MANVTVGCKLPHGLVLTLPNSKVRVTLNGANNGTVVGLDGKVVRGTCGYTQVDENFIASWLKLYGETTMVKQQMIFVQKNEASAAAKAAELAKEKTGFEAVDPAKPGVNGIKPVPKTESGEE